MEIKRAGSQASAKGEEVPLFRRLSDNFELCVTALNLLRCDSDEFFVEGMT